MSSKEWYPGKNLGRFVLKRDKSDMLEHLPEWFPEWLYNESSEKQLKEYRDLIYWSGVLHPQDLKQIPETAYHVTPEPYKIISEGFRTSKELGKQSFGGHGKYISVTTYDNALDYLESLRIVTRIMNGEISFSELKKWIIANCGENMFNQIYHSEKIRRKYDNKSLDEDDPDFQWDVFEKVFIYTHDGSPVCKVLYMGKPTSLIGKKPEDIRIVEVKPSPELRFRHEYNIFSEEDMSPYYTHNTHETEWRIWDPGKATPIKILNA